MEVLILLQWDNLQLHTHLTPGFCRESLCIYHLNERIRHMKMTGLAAAHLSSLKLRSPMPFIPVSFKIVPTDILLSPEGLIFFK